MRCCLTVLLVTGVLSSVAVAATPQAVPDDALRKIVAHAPPVPADLRLGLKMHLIDFIDCTDPDDPHDFRDQGTSRVVTGRAGTYRVTAAHRHAFFSYAYRTAGRDKPVVLVIEYPDDAERVISFMTDDSTRSPTRQGAYAQETGVYTGHPLPLTHRMQLFTLFAWPQDDWSPVMVFNFTRCGGSGAASRIWVYQIDAMPPLEVDEPDPAHPRVLDAFFCCSFLAKRDNFGYKSPRSIEHMCEYFNLIGVNRVTMMVYMNQSWGAACTIPAWDADDKGYLDDILTQMDRAGAVGFIAGIVADGMYGKVISGGKEVAKMPPDEARAVVIKGVDQFIDRYGKYKALKGVALGSMETIGFFDTLQSKGIAADVVAHIRRRRPDWEVLTYVGNVRLQTPQFDGKHGPAAWDVVADWETTGNKPWSAFLAGKVHENWKTWKHDPADLRAIPGLSVYEMFHPDDHRLHDLYRQEPRAMMCYDVDRSPERSVIADTPHAAIFSTFSEGEVGLHKEVNFWYTNPWTAPDFNAAGPFALAPFARAMAHRDRQAISAGTWSMKYFGLEPGMRRFARAFRSLPPVEMQPHEDGHARGRRAAGLGGRRRGPMGPLQGQALHGRAEPGPDVMQGAGGFEDLDAQTVRVGRLVGHRREGTGAYPRPACGVRQVGRGPHCPVRETLRGGQGPESGGSAERLSWCGSPGSQAPGRGAPPGRRSGTRRGPRQRDDTAQGDSRSAGTERSAGQRRAAHERRPRRLAGSRVGPDGRGR